MIEWMLDQAVAWVLGSVQDTLDVVWKVLFSTLFHLPDVTALPQVEDLSARALLVVNIGYVLVISAVGAILMMRSGLPIRYEAGELLPLLIVGLAAANFATRICATIITSANALVLALTSAGFASDTALERVMSLTNGALNNPASALLVAVIGLTVVALLVMLTAGWIHRFVVLVLLCGIAPLALAGHGTPWTDEAARLWWRCMLGVCLTVILQALALNTSVAIFLTSGTDLSRYGLPADPTGLFDLFIVAVLLWITVRIPALVRQYVTQARGRQNLFGTLVRLVIAQQVTRGLTQRAHAAAAGALSGGRSRARPGGLTRHLRGATPGRAGAPRRDGRPAGPGAARRGGHAAVTRPTGGGSGGHSGTGQRAHGWGDLPVESSRGAHRRTGRHVVGPGRIRTGSDTAPSTPTLRQHRAASPHRPRGGGR